MIKITLLHPSRWRADLAHNAFNEWVNNARYPEEIQYVLSLDDNDETIAEYENKFSAEDRARVGLFVFNVSPSRNIVQAVNSAATFMESTSEIFAIVSDDVSAPLGWDVLLKNKLAGVDNFNTPKYIGVDDGLQSFGTFFIYIANRAYYNRLGYVLYPEYDGVFADNDNACVAYALGAVVPAPELVFKHNHYSKGAISFDRTYAKHNTHDGLERNGAIFNARRSRNFDL